MHWLGTSVVILVLFLVTGLVIVASERSLNKPGGRSAAAAMGDGLGNMIDVFDPAMGRARIDIKEQSFKTEIAPVPDPEDPDGPVFVINDVTGRPAIVRITPPEASASEH